MTRLIPSCASVLEINSRAVRMIDLRRLDRGEKGGRVVIRGRRGVVCLAKEAVCHDFFAENECFFAEV